MIPRVLLQLLSLTATAVGCLVLPLLGMRALFPTLERTAPTVANYRGRRIAYGVGLVWLLWTGGAFLAGALQNLIAEMARTITLTDTVKWYVFLESWPARNVVAIALVGCAFGFGVVDDLFGDRSDRGFRGHVGAMLRGRLTTGGLKLLGIGAAAAFTAANTVNGRLMSEIELFRPGFQQGIAWVLAWVLGTLVIALSANLVNLTDLRPGRAWKSYGALAVLAVVITQATEAAEALAGTTVVHPWIEWLGGAMIMLVAVAGPLVAGWRLDLSERSMLGDAGANAAGALAGYLLASALPLVGMAAAALVLLALNVASERVSFSEVIERNAVLRYLDGLGRVRDGEDGAIGDAEGDTGAATS